MCGDMYNRFAGRAQLRTLSTQARRSLLYIPGSSERMLAKSRTTPADTLVYDLEDSVAAHCKNDARRLVAAEIAATPSVSELAVRINAPHTQQSLAAADLDAVLETRAKVCVCAVG